MTAEEESNLAYARGHQTDLRETHIKIPGCCMLEGAKLICDVCKLEISFAGKTSLHVLVELVKDAPDRHYCEKCIREATRLPDRRPVEELRKRIF